MYNEMTVYFSSQKMLWNFTVQNELDSEIMKKIL